MSRRARRALTGGCGIAVIAFIGAQPTAGPAHGSSGALHPSVAGRAAEGQSRTYRPVTVTDGATLTGRVVFTGRTSNPRRLLITKDIEVCGEGYRERHDVVTAGEGSLLHVVIYIEDIEEGKHWADTGRNHVLNQEDCVFVPHLQVVPRGAALDIINSDPVLHNIHSYEMVGSTRRTLFNLGQPDRGTITRTLTPRRGNHIRVECDAHDFMLGWIYSADSPYYSMVDTGGRFEIADIPPGTYVITAWHPFLGVQQREVTFGTGETEQIVFEFSDR